MSYDVSRAVIETLVRKAVMDIRDAPQRSARNLVDMALSFSEGQFQNRFFQAAQAMLRKENSAYYTLIPDVAANVDTDRIVAFGMNLGYNSCTSGAKTIRSIEQRERFNIPWSLTLAISEREFAAREPEYRSVLEQGMALGIYTWMIHAPDGIGKILSLAEACPECAFVFFCNPEEITGPVLDEAENRKNVMFGVCHRDGVEEACRLLRSRKFLYSVYHIYGPAELEDLLSGELTSDTQSLHPAFTAFLPEPDCPESVQKEVFRYVTRTRNSQECPTVMWEAVRDSRVIDGIISDGACSAGFDPKGNLCVFRDHLERLEFNLFRQPLADILKQAFPKDTHRPDMENR